jgi:hypothetical protein
VFASRLRRSAGVLRAQRADFERICHAPRGKKEILRKYFGFGLESSFWRSQKQNEVLPTNLFLFRLWRNAKR